MPNEPLRARGESRVRLLAAACALALVLHAGSAAHALAAAPSSLEAAQHALAVGRYAEAEAGFRALEIGRAHV